MKNMVCFGEVLWDVFPSHKKIGGAPLNVAFRLQFLKNNVCLLSRIGDDHDGKEIIKRIKENGIDDKNIQVDDRLKTGIVKVMLNEKGSASYDIKFPSAWDNIQLTANAKKITATSNAFIFGSLVARDSVSRATLYALLKLAKYKIFDINLRAPYYELATLKDLMIEADFIKFNDDEIFEIAELLNSRYNSLEQNIRFIAEQTNTKSICVTKGRHGAVLYYNNVFYYNSGYKIVVVDTVGAGDAFLASLIDKLLKGFTPQKAIDFACAVGALVASSKGANSKINNDDIEKFINYN